MKSVKEIPNKDIQSITNLLNGKLLSKQMFRGFPAWSLLFSNLFIAVYSIIDKQNVFNILWVYWFQSVIIGVLNFLKIITLKEYNVDGLKMNNKPIEKTKNAKAFVAVFFLFHYGFFHFVYAVFLIAFISEGSVLNSGLDKNFILLASFIFFINYLIEFIVSFRGESTVESLPKLMFSPYKRIIPMHITIIASGFVFAGGVISSVDPNIVILLIFIGLKTLVDLATHSN